MAEYGGYRSKYRRSKQGRKREEQSDAVATALTAQLLLCVLLLVVAVICKKTDERRYAAFRRQYDVMVSESSAGLTADYIGKVSESAETAFIAIGNWLGSLVAHFTNGQSTRMQPEEEFVEEEATVAKDASHDAYLPENMDLTMTGAGGWYPVAVGSRDADALSAPRTAVLSPVMLSAALKPPVTGLVTSAFAYRYHPITQAADFHTGIDIAAEEGRSILAALPGEVVEVGESAIYGNYIILQHATNLKTFYAHCSEIIAKEGMSLRQGERIAKVGQTGTATGPHLHFSVIVDELYTDPYWVLGDNIRVVG